MIERTSQKIIVVLGVITALAVLGYFVFNGADIPTTEADLASQDVLGQDIITLAEKMENITIDDSVFTSAIFMSLIDMQIPLAPESQGRANPFATIGNESGAPPTTLTGGAKPPITPPF